MILNGSAGAFAFVICSRTSRDKFASFWPSSASLAVKGDSGAWANSAYAQTDANPQANSGLFRINLLLPDSCQSPWLSLTAGQCQGEYAFGAAPDVL